MTVSDNEKSLNNAANGYQMLITTHVFNQKVNLSFSKEDNVQCGLSKTANLVAKVLFLCLVFVFCF